MWFKHFRCGARRCHPSRAVSGSLWPLISAAAFTVLAGCHHDHRQSMLHPASSASTQIAWLWWFLLAVCGAVFVAVMALTAVAVWGRTRDRERSPLGNRFVVYGGLVIPSIILIAILVASVRTQVALDMPETDLTVRVIGHMWWWEIHYPDHDIVTANEIHLPVGRPVRVELQSADVIHSLWVPNLQGKMDMLPDKTNVTYLSSDREGVFRGQCAEYCGVQHALMGLRVIVLGEDDFEQWLAARKRSRDEERDGEVRRGEQVFFEVGCHGCHAVEGSKPTQLRGPDLTHLASRTTIAAGLLENNHGNLSGWVSNPQTLKPGNLMPRTHIPADDFQALLKYLQSLK